MKTIELRTRYLDNIEVIKKLNRIFEMASDSEQKKLAKEAIIKVENEQVELNKKIRKDIYKSVSKKDIESLLKNKEKKVVINKKDEIVIDIDDVVIKEVEEDNKPLKVINITEKEPIKKEIKENDDITEVLKEKVSLPELKDAKIVFDGTYKLIYDDGNKVYEKEINDTLLNHNIKEEKSSFNYNIIKLLKDFDEENGTRLYYKYMINDIDVTYDFSKINNSNNRKQINKVKKIASRESKTFNNVKVKDNRMKKFRTGLATIAAAGLLLLGGMHGLNNHSKNSFNNDRATVANAGQTDAAIESVTEYHEVSTETAKVEEINEEKDVVNTVEVEKNTTEEVTKENNSLRIGDKYELDSTDLFYTSMDDEARGNTKYINGNYNYKASIISVVYNKQVMELIYNDSIDLDALSSICKEKYGDDVKISINFDLVDENDNVVTKHVGWVNSNDVLSKGKVLTR